MSKSPETYWLSITEKARNECRAVANELLLLAVARKQAVAVTPAASLSGIQLDRLAAALQLTKLHRVKAILDAVFYTFKTKTTAELDA